MKQVLLLVFICSSSILSSHTQPLTANLTFIDTIRGFVTDSATKTVLSHVTVEAQELQNDRIVKSTMTNEKGAFEIITAYRSDLSVRFSYSGYKSITLKLTPHSSSIYLGQLVLAPLTEPLPEIQIITKKPLLEQDLDKIIYNVEADPESKTATAFEILGKIPMLSFDADENLQLNGSGDYRLLINGKISSFFVRNESDALKYFSASAIRAIEVMTIPPSKYAAQGVGGIINIITYKEITGGYNGAMSVRAISPQSLSTNGNVAIKYGKIGFSGNAGYNYNSNPTTSNASFRQDKIRREWLEQTGSGKGNGTSQSIGSEVSYELNRLDQITAGYSINKGNSDNRFHQEVMFVSAAGTPVQTYRNINSGRNNQYGNDVRFEYQHSFTGNELQLLTISYNRSSSNDRITTDFTLQPLLNYNGSANTTSNSDAYCEQTFQANYVQPIKKQLLEIGASAVLRNNSSDYFYKKQDSITGVFVLDTNQSNRFHYKENINAAYASLNLLMGKWSLKFGARLEQAEIHAQFVTSGTFTRREYLNPIPTITLSHKLKGFSLIKLSYTQRINRPDLGYLNPYIDLTDPWNISYGNPNLQPALAHVFNLAYSTLLNKTYFNLALYHQFTNNSIQQVTTFGSDTTTRTTFGNIGQNRNYNLSASINTTFLKKISLNINGNTNFIKYTSNINGKPHSNQGLTFSLSGSLNLRVKNWRAGSYASYNAPNVLLQGKTAGFFTNSISLNKAFLKNNKMTVGILVNSPFCARRHSYTETNDPTFYRLQESYSQARRFNLSVNYRFGKVQAGVRK